MTSRRSTSWASVVANGIIDEPLQPMLPLSSAKPRPSTGKVSSSVSQWPVLALKPMSTITAKVAPTKTGVPGPNSERIVLNASAQPAALLPPTPTSTPRAVHCPLNRMPSLTDLRRPFRSVWPRQPTPFPDHRHHQRSSSQGGSYRPRRHHHEFRTRAACPYSSGQVPPRCPAPLNWQPRGPRPMMKPLIAGYGNLAQPEKRLLTSYYPPMRMPSPLSVEQNVSPPNLIYDRDQQQYKPVMPDIHEGTGSSEKRKEEASKEDQPRGPRVSVSPRARSRCQVTLSSAQYEITQWQPIGESRQVWDPLDLNGRDLDPSNPNPPPPPGFEHVVTGKRSLSSRARKLMGEPVRMGSYKNYPTPTPMMWPERELREQQHYIAEHDTHLTCRMAQLRVTNGATGDGYYVRPVAKLLPKVAKVLVPPKYQSSFHPDVSYWELLRRNREKDAQTDKLPLQDRTDIKQSDTFIKMLSDNTTEANIDPFAPLLQVGKANPLMQFSTCSPVSANPVGFFPLPNHEVEANKDPAI